MSVFSRLEINRTSKKEPITANRRNAVLPEETIFHNDADIEKGESDKDSSENKTVIGKFTAGVVNNNQSGRNK